MGRARTLTGGTGAAGRELVPLGAAVVALAVTVAAVVVAGTSHPNPPPPAAVQADADRGAGVLVTTRASGLGLPVSTLGSEALVAGAQLLRPVAAAPPARPVPATPAGTVLLAGGSASTAPVTATQPPATVAPGGDVGVLGSQDSGSHDGQDTRRHGNRGGIHHRTGADGSGDRTVATASSSSSSSRDRGRARPPRDTGRRWDRAHRPGPASGASAAPEHHPASRGRTRSGPPTAGDRRAASHVRPA